jgi:predicted metal-binding membrane protein
MTGAAPGSARLAPRRLPTLIPPEAAVLTLLAAAAWTATAVLGRRMAATPGTMGLPAWEFLLVWTLMMAAMMLPAVGVTGSIYARTIRTRRAARLAAFVGGYLLVWVVTGMPALGLAALAGRLAADQPGVAHGLAVGVFAAAGFYQLSPLKDRCLARCRSPFGLLMRYGSYRGRFRDLRVGLHHGAYCLGCCWALMALLVAVGVMNLVAMVAVAALVVTEKLAARGPAVGRLAGVALLALAVIAVWEPSVAPGLDRTMAAPMGMSA